MQNKHKKSTAIMILIFGVLLLVATIFSIINKNNLEIIILNGFATILCFVIVITLYSDIRKNK